MILILSISLNLLVIIFIKNIRYIAIANTLTFYIWYFYSSKHFHLLSIRKSEVIYLIFFVFLFFLFTTYLNGIDGFILYLISITTLNYIFYKREFMKILNKIKFVLLNFRNRGVI
jgi:hypothetical protein